MFRKKKKEIDLAKETTEIQTHLPAEKIKGEKEFQKEAVDKIKGEVVGEAVQAAGKIVGKFTLRKVVLGIAKLSLGAKIIAAVAVVAVVVVIPVLIVSALSGRGDTPVAGSSNIAAASQGSSSGSAQGKSQQSSGKSTRKTAAPRGGVITSGTYIDNFSRRLTFTFRRDNTITMRFKGNPEVLEGTYTTRDGILRITTAKPSMFSNRDIPYSADANTLTIDGGNKFTKQ